MSGRSQPISESLVNEVLGEYTVHTYGMSSGSFQYSEVECGRERTDVLIQMHTFPSMAVLLLHLADDTSG